MTEKVSLYRCYSGDGELLYVGISNDIERRMAEHRQAKAEWVPVCDRVDIMSFRCRQDAANAEMRAVRTENPQFNTVGNNSVFVSEYFFRLGMTDEMRRQIEAWRAENPDPVSGKIPSFAEACRQLIMAGLDRRKGGKEDGDL